MHAKLSSVVRATAIVTMMVLAAIAVSSCGGGKSSSTAKPSPPASAGPTPSAGGRSPKYGGTLVVALSGDPGLLNPALSPSGLLHPVTGQIFDGLVRLDDHYNPLPDLARSWDVAKDGRTYTFHLARGVRWHDGRPFSSADVKYSYDDVLLKFGSRTRQLAAVIQGIDTPDANIVVFHLRTRYTPFLKWLDEDNGAILPAHLFRGTNPLTNPADARPVGTGPFMFQSEIKGNQITLVRNPHYFESGKPYLDRIVFRVIPPPQALQAFQAGEVQLLLFPTPPDLRVLERMPGVTVTEEGRQGFARVVRMIPNLRRKPFDDVRVRQAISYAIDRPFIAKAAYGGTLQPATGPISSDFKPWYTDAVMKFPHDPAQAKSLLDQAGLKPGSDGVRLRTSLIFDPAFALTAALLKTELSQVGIGLNLQVMDFNAWVNKLYVKMDFDLGYSQITDPADPDIGTRALFACDNRVPVPFANGAGYCNREVDSLFARAARTPDTATRIVLYDKAQQLIVRDQPNFFLVGGIGSPFAWSDKFAGVDAAGAKSPYYFGQTTYSTSGSTSPPSGK